MNSEQQSSVSSGPALNPLRPEHNGILTVMNMQPRAFRNDRKISGILQMQLAVAQAAEMGFNAVWVNPIADVGILPKPIPEAIHRGNYLPYPTDEKRSGSLYAMRDPNGYNEDIFVPTGLDKAAKEASIEQNIVKFTQCVRDHNMVPIFDIVLSHVSKDSPIVTDGKLDNFVQRPRLGRVNEAIDTTNWIKRYKSGGLKGQPEMHGVNENAEIIEDEKLVWSDVALFNYDDPRTRQEIIDKLWKPFIDRYVEMGFQGIRVDSIAQNTHEVLEPVLSYFKKKVHEKWGIPEDQVVVLGETLGAKEFDYYRNNNQVTHAYSSVKFTDIMRRPDGTLDINAAKEEWGQNGWLMKQQGQLQELAQEYQLGSNKGSLRPNAKGGAIGFPGSHDEQDTIVNRFIDKRFTLFKQDFATSGDVLYLIHPETGYVTDRSDMQVFVDDANGKRVPLRITKDNISDYIDVNAAASAMREQIAQTSLIGAGFFLYSGDEKMVIDRRSVFKDHQKFFELADVDPRADMVPLVTDINAMLHDLPANSRGSWAKRVFLDGREDILVIERHSGHGYDGRADIMIVNCESDPEKQRPLEKEDIEKLAGLVKLQTGRTLNVDDFVKAASCRGENGKIDSASDRENIVHMDRSVRLSKELMQSTPQPVVKSAGVEAAPAMTGWGRS